MSSIKFNKDLENGKIAENEIKALFETCGYNVSTTQSKGKFENYDLIVSTSTSTEYVEVKYDLSSAKTGNIAVELYKTVNNQVLPSGLSATKADLIIYKIPNDPNYYGYQPFQLYNLIEQEKHKAIKPNSGDGNRTCIALFDLNTFKENAYKINYKTLNS